MNKIILLILSVFLITGCDQKREDKYIDPRLAMANHFEKIESELTERMSNAVLNYKNQQRDVMKLIIDVRATYPKNYEYFTRESDAAHDQILSSEEKLSLALKDVQAYGWSCVILNTLPVEIEKGYSLECLANISVADIKDEKFKYEPWGLLKDSHIYNLSINTESTQAAKKLYFGDKVYFDAHLNNLQRYDDTKSIKINFDKTVITKVDY